MTTISKATPAIGVTVVIGIIAILGSAAPPPKPYVAPASASVSNQYFDASVSARESAFDLTITNKTSKDLEVDWNKTLYIASGTTSGGFMFEGVVYSARNNPKPPDVVFANSTFRKTIFPNNLVTYTSGKYGGWSNQPIGRGSGVYLTVKAGNEEVREKIMPQ